mmetsp:Transcript_73998/g.192683  ORF Transcript_73998/g.192683 Transcript_73998/m.192683 type:complete len:214 (-) Transcript_73998:2100-2741(-)
MGADRPRGHGGVLGFRQQVKQRRHPLPDDGQRVGARVEQSGADHRRRVYEFPLVVLARGQGRPRLRPPADRGTAGDVADDAEVVPRRGVEHRAARRCCLPGQGAEARREGHRFRGVLGELRRRAAAAAHRLPLLGDAAHHRRRRCGPARHGARRGLARGRPLGAHLHEVYQRHDLGAPDLGRHLSRGGLPDESGFRARDREHVLVIRRPLPPR